MSKTQKRRTKKHRNEAICALYAKLLDREITPLELSILHWMLRRLGIDFDIKNLASGSRNSVIVEQEDESKDRNYTYLGVWDARTDSKRFLAFMNNLGCHSVAIHAELYRQRMYEYLFDLKRPKT